MHNGNNEDAIAFNRVKNGVGKYINQTPANVLLQDSPTLGGGEDFCDGNSDLAVEASSKLAPALPIIPYRLLEFPHRFRMERVLHFASRRSIRR